MKKFFVLFAFFFASIALQAQYPVVGDMSDIVWSAGSGADHRGVSFHPSSLYVTGVVNFYNTIDVLAVEDSGKAVRIYKSATSPVFSRGGRYFAYVDIIGYGLFNIPIVDLEADTIKTTLKGVPSTTIDISPDEKLLAVGSHNRVDLYNIETGQIVRSKTPIAKPQPDGRDPNVIYLLFLPDGKQIFIWLYNPFHVQPVFASYIWDIETDTIIAPVMAPPISITPDGTKLAHMGGGIGRIVTVIDTRTKEVIGYVPSGPQIDNIEDMQSISISPDGRYLAFIASVAADDPLYYRIGVWDLTMQKLVYVFPKATGIYGNDCAFSPNGKYLAIGWSIHLLDFERIKRKIEAVGVPEEPAKNEFFVYYNPLKVDYITIDYPMEEIVPTTITIYNMYGNKVREVECGAILYKYGRYDIPSGQLPSGVYFVVINSGGKIVAQKFMVVH